MPSPYKFSINPPSDAADRDDHEQVAQHANSRAEPQSPAQLSRLADMVACGELPLPDGLLPDQLEHLVREVRKRRRDRLVGHIARAIAKDICRSREP